MPCFAPLISLPQARVSVYSWAVIPLVSHIRHRIIPCLRDPRRIAQLSTQDALIQGTAYPPGRFQNRQLALNDREIEVNRQDSRLAVSYGKREARDCSFGGSQNDEKLQFSNSSSTIQQSSTKKTMTVRHTRKEPFDHATLKNNIVALPPKAARAGVSQRSSDIQPAEPLSNATGLVEWSISGRDPDERQSGKSQNWLEPATVSAQTSGIAQSQREPWQMQKSALSRKFGGSGWSPRKRLSPDSLDGIRSLHAQNPERNTTAALANYFKVSPEAIRRILKSKWRPNDDEEDKRRERWNRRGMNIWGQMNQLGIKPPRKWRQQGVGKTEDRILARNKRYKTSVKKDSGIGYYPGSLLNPSAISHETIHPISLGERIL